MNNRFRQACLARGVSLATVARDIGCSISELTQIESGQIPVPPELATRLAEYLGDEHLNDHFLSSSKDGCHSDLGAAERELLSCYRRMREGQKRVLSELATLMALQGRESDEGGLDRA